MRWEVIEDKSQRGTKQRYASHDAGERPVSERETGFQLAAIHHVAVKAALCALTFIKSRPQKQNLCLCLIFFALQMDDSPVGFMCRNRKFVSVKA